MSGERARRAGRGRGTSASIAIQAATRCASLPRRALPAVAAAVGAVALAAAVIHPGGWPWTLPLILLVVPLAEFALAPLWRASGAYRYHSPLLFSVRRAGATELHAGTSYDYLLRFRWRDRGRNARRIVLRDLLSGLLAVADEVGTGQIPRDAPVTIDSHVLSDRTARAFGFEMVPARAAERLHLMLDILAISAMQSFVRGRPALARVWRARHGVARPADLAAAAPRIRVRLERIERRSAASRCPDGEGYG